MGQAVGVQPLAGIPGIGFGGGYAVIGMPGEEVQGRAVGGRGNMGQESLKEIQEIACSGGYVGRGGRGPLQVA